MNKGRAVYWHPELIESLKDTDEAIAYLNVALEDDDPRMFLIALRNVLEAQGFPMQDVAKKSNLSHRNI